MTDIHSCSYYCERPACIKAQRDELRSRLAQPEQPAKIDIDYWVSSRPQIIEAVAKAGYTLMSNANGFWLELAPQPKRHELQAKGEHPAPCARHCEATAFQIVINNLKAQLAQPEQEPLQFKCTIVDDAHPNGVPLEQCGKQPEQGGKTGWPAGMLQDDSRELSKALASKPDAKQHAREAAHGIKGKA